MWNNLWILYGFFRMGVSRVFGLCAALFSFSALAADPPVPRGNVSVTLNPTTSYYVVNRTTLNTPRGVSVSPIRDITPYVSRYSGGIQQTLPTGIDIEAINKGAPLPVVARATTNSLKAAATRCLTGFKCNLAFMAGSIGLQHLLDGVDWVMNEGGNITHIDPSQANDVYHGSPTGYSASQMAATTYDQRLCASISPTQVCVEVIPNSDGITSRARYCTGSVSGYPLTGYDGVMCYYGGDGYNYPPEPQPVPTSDIHQEVYNSYNPDPADWRFLSPQLILDDLEITSAPTLQSEPKTTTIYDADGNPVQVKETNVWFDFDIRDNPSPKPSLDLKQREEEKTYENGQLTGTTTTTTTTPAPTYPASGGSQPPPELELPSFCDWAGVICDWLGWTQEPVDDDDLDLASLINDEDFERNYSISFGDGTCPAPIEINVIFLNQTVELSYEPACELAGHAKPFVLISAYIFAIFITLGAVRNG